MLTEDHIQHFMYQLLKGVLYIHSSSIVHRDLKPSNILVSEDCHLKICDLGLSRGGLIGKYESQKVPLTE